MSGKPPTRSLLPNFCVSFLEVLSISDNQVMGWIVCDGGDLPFPSFCSINVLFTRISGGIRQEIYPIMAAALYIKRKSCPDKFILCVLMCTVN